MKEETIMNSKVMLYIILSFILGLTLFLFTSFTIDKGKRESTGIYRLYIENDGQTIYVFDTQTGSFKTYISEAIYRSGGDTFRYLLIDEADPSSGLAKLKEAQKKKVEMEKNEKKNNPYAWTVKEYNKLTQQPKNNLNK